MPASGEARALALLPPAEQADLARFGRPELRRRALVARAATRAILADYLGAEPPGLRFDSGELGKPRLAVATAGDAPALRFNVSHSLDRALVAVTRDTPVGIDVERLRAVRQIEALATRYLAPAEQSRLLSLPAEDRSLHFLRLWVGKEALAKAVGEGLQFGLRRIELRLAEDPAARTRLAAIDDDPHAATGWTLAALTEPGDYAAAVATPRAGMSVRRSSWEL